MGSCAPAYAQHYTTLANSNDSTLTATTEASPETADVQAKLNACTSGSSVELKSGPGNAFVLGGLKIPAGVSITLQAGITVFASLTASDFDNDINGVSGNNQCGKFNTGDNGCKALFNFQGSNSGLYGYGVVDGRGWANPGGDDLTCTTNGSSWWQRTLELGDSGCTQAYGKHQNNPKLISAVGDNFTLYRVTLRNAPFWHVLWRPATVAGGLTVWSIKVNSPWNVGNTDGIDVDGSNVYITDSIFAVGDDEVAIEAPTGGFYWPGYSGTLHDVLIDGVTGYGRNGISIGSEIKWDVNGIQVSNSNLTTRNVSAVNNGPNNWTVNGKTTAQINTIFGHTVADPSQLLPSTAGSIRGLNIKTDDPGTARTVSGIMYNNVCLQDIVQPITVQPYTSFPASSTVTNVAGVTYKDLHILPPDLQMYSYGDASKIYSVAPQSSAYFQNANTSIYNGVTFDNFVSDNQTGTSFSTLGYLKSENTNYTIKNNIYPHNFTNLSTSQQDNTDHVHTSITSSTGTLSGTVTTTQTADNCSTSGSGAVFPFLSVDGYVSSSGHVYTHASTTGSPLTISSTALTFTAMVQPAMSGTGFYASPDYSNTTPGQGLIAVASPAPTGTVTFQLDGVAQGSPVSIGSNGLATSSTITMSSGTTHKLTAWYPGDTYYPSTWKTYYVTTP